MVSLDLTNAEIDILKGLLDYELSELHRELADTDNWKFKENLKEKEKTLRKILASFEGAKATA